MGERVVPRLEIKGLKVAVKSGCCDELGEEGAQKSLQASLPGGLLLGRDHPNKDASGGYRRALCLLGGLVVGVQRRPSVGRDTALPEP